MRSTSLEATYAEARQNFARLLDRVTENREVIYIRRRGRERVALVAADELSGLLEAAHLLRSPRNAARLLSALHRAMKHEGQPNSVAGLRRRLRLDKE